MTQCILFDSDGTLVDSELLCNRAIAIKFKELGVDLCEHDLMLRFRGGKMSEVLAQLSEQNDVQLADDFLLSYRKLVAQLFESDLKPVEGVIEALQQLPMHKAVVSNGPREKIIQALEVCGIRHYFCDNIYSAYDINCWKPAAGIYQHAAADMGFTTKQCVVIEDSPTGVLAGINAGISTYYYNILTQPCEFSQVIEFDSMCLLPSLLNKS